MLRATISTHRGFVTSLFAPNHCEFNISSKNDINMQAGWRSHTLTQIMLLSSLTLTPPSPTQIAVDKIGSYSGTKNLVTDKQVCVRVVSHRLHGVALRCVVLRCVALR